MESQNFQRKEDTSPREWSPLFTITFALALVIVILAPLRNPFVLDDGIRHFTLASLLVRDGLPSFSGWGDFFFAGYFAEFNSDPWFLFDVILMPLADLPLVFALKVFTVLSVAALLGAMWLLLRPLRLTAMQRSVLLLLFLLGENEFFIRLFLARPFNVITIIFILTIAAVLKKNWVAIFFLLCAATLFHYLFVFPLFVGIAGSIWLWITHEKHSAFRVFCAASLGVAAGLLLHPHTWNYLHFIVRVFPAVPFLRDIGLGMELEPGFLKSFTVWPTVAS